MDMGLKSLYVKPQRRHERRGDLQSLWPPSMRRKREKMTAYEMLMKKTAQLWGTTKFPEDMMGQYALGS